MITGILSVLFWMVLVPLGIGFLFTAWLSDQSSILVKSYLFGLVAFFAVFHVLIVANLLTINQFSKVCTSFSILVSVSALIGAFLFIKMRVWKAIVICDCEKEEKNKRLEKIILWILFGAIVIFQIIMALLYTYPDGDDAYYVGVATYGADIDKMYSRIPYTGARTTFDTRHCLAPFPYLISFLAKMSGVKPVIIAHSIFPVLFLLFAYGIFYLIAKLICKEKREVSLYMLLISILLMFGNYSVYSMETFLMTRTRQGKASLGSFALPLAFYLLFLLANYMEKSRKDRVIVYIILFLNGIVAALFTTLGNFIYSCMIAVGGLCICFSKKEWKKLFVLALTCVPSVIMVILYVLIR